MKPVIGITTDYSDEQSPLRICLEETYTMEVRRAGGLPVLLPLAISAEDAGEYASKLDGILFSGGSDMAPHLFNEEPIRELNCLLSARDYGELALMKEAGRLRLPVFGICRGCQTINVALGGTLYQDIPRQIPGAGGHYQKGTPDYEPYHSVSIPGEDSRMAAVFKKSVVRTNSFHHQSVKQLGRGLRVTAQSADGVIEAYEGTDSEWYIHAVQFHPEAMGEKHPEFRGLFSDFVTACVKHAEACCK